MKLKLLLSMLCIMVGFQLIAQNVRIPYHSFKKYQKQQVDRPLPTKKKKYSMEEKQTSKRLTIAKKESRSLQYVVPSEEGRELQRKEQFMHKPSQSSPFRLPNFWYKHQ